MKALVITKLSGPDALALEDAAEPTIKPGQTIWMPQRFQRGD